MKKIAIGVYWGPRRESVLECANRLGQHFEALRQLSEALSLWYRQASRKQKAMESLEVFKPEALVKLLERGVNRRDDNHQPIAELGFRVSLWNGDRGGWSAATQVGCGMYSPVKGLSNVALLSVDFSTESSLKPEEMLLLLRRMIEIWDPDTGKVFRNVEIAEKGDDGLDWEEVVYALYRSSSALVEPRVVTGEVESFARGLIWIETKKYHLFES